MANGLSIDPSKTATLRRASLNDLKGRFLAFSDAVEEYGDAGDMTTVQYVKWLEDQADKYIYRGLAQSVSKLTQEAYAQGASRSYDESKRSVFRTDAAHAAARGQFLESVMPSGAFNAVATGEPRPPAKLEATAARFYTEVDATARHLLRLLTREVVTSPEGTPASAAAVVEGIVLDVIRKNVAAVANTEIVRAHAWGQLDGFAALGFHKVTAISEVNIDGSGCPDCAANADLITPISKAYAVIPMHPYCRCAWASSGRPKK